MKVLRDDRYRWGVLAYAMLIAAAILFFCTKSSFAYPINDWCDANIYLSIGKGMTRGMVVYRDLYDHKGPLLYALHALCALVSFNDFTGVFVMEVLLATAFLCYAWRILALYGARRAAWLALPVLALVVYASFSFAEGDSAEELCMPLVTATMYYVLRDLREGRSGAWTIIAQGVLAGCVFWIKFTIIGLHAGLLLALCVARGMRAKSWGEGFRTLGLLVVGFVLSTLPWLLYFGANGAIMPWLKTYFYDNLVLYGGESMPIIERIKTILTYGYGWVIYDLQYTLLVFAGLIWFLFARKRTHAPERLCVWLTAGLGALGVFVGCKSYPYYGQALSPLAVLGLIPLGLLAEKLLPKGKRERGVLIAAAACLCAGCVALCPLTARNVNTSVGAKLGDARESTMQYRFAKTIAETPNATLLNYGFMDAGFYTAAGVVPNVKYFQENNVPLNEMYAEQKRYIEEALCDYVVTRGNESQELFAQYELVDTVDSPNFWYQKAYLYKRKGI